MRVDVQQWYVLLSHVGFGEISVKARLSVVIKRYGAAAKQLRRVYYVVHVAKRTTRSRRRFCSSIANIFKSTTQAMKLTAAIVLLSASASAWTADKVSSRRDVLNKVAGAAAVVAAPGVAGAYSVPDLEYGFDALEPFMYVAS